MMPTSCRQKGLQWARNSHQYMQLLYFVLRYLGKTLHRKVEEVFDLNFKTYIEENSKRFLDDCFILFRKSDEDLPELINTLHPSLNFTMDKSRIKLSFLDTMVINNNWELQKLIKPLVTNFGFGNDIVVNAKEEESADVFHAKQMLLENCTRITHLVRNDVGLLWLLWLWYLQL